LIRRSFNVGMINSRFGQARLSRISRFPLPFTRDLDDAKAVAIALCAIGSIHHLQ